MRIWWRNQTTLKPDNKTKRPNAKVELLSAWLRWVVSGCLALPLQRGLRPPGSNRHLRRMINRPALDRYQHERHPAIVVALQLKSRCRCRLQGILRRSVRVSLRLRYPSQQRKDSQGPPLVHKRFHFQLALAVPRLDLQRGYLPLPLLPQFWDPSQRNLRKLLLPPSVSCLHHRKRPGLRQKTLTRIAHPES